MPGWTLLFTVHQGPWRDRALRAARDPESKVFRNRLEFVHRCSIGLGVLLRRGIQAMVEVVVNQCSLCRVDGAFHAGLVARIVKRDVKLSKA